MEEHLLYNGKEKLNFYGEGNRHDYVWGDKDLPSSTQITNIIDKPGLRYWYVNQALERVEKNLKPGVSYDEVQIGKILKKAKYGGADSRDDAASVGKIVHNWIEDHVSALISSSRATMPMPKHTGAVRSIENFLEWEFQVQPEYVFSERLMLSREHEFAGTLDIAAYVDPFHLGLAKKKGDKPVPTIIDIKTGKKVYPEYWLQLASYCLMVAEEQPEGFEEYLYTMQRLILNVSQATGKMSDHVAGSSLYDDAETFLALRAVYKWKEGK